MTTILHKKQLRFVAKIAATQLDQLSPLERAELLDGLALILEGDESKTCEYAALCLRKAESAQLTFKDLLSKS